MSANACQSADWSGLMPRSARVAEVDRGDFGPTFTACRKIAGALKALPTSDQRAERLCSIIERQLELLEDGDELLEDGGRTFGLELLGEMKRLIT